eukprot:4214318-Pleurochrysis_carterae.AAC.1
MAVIVRPSRIHNFRPVTLSVQPRTRTSVELCALLSQRKEQHARAPTCASRRALLRARRGARSYVRVEARAPTCVPMRA